MNAWPRITTDAVRSRFRPRIGRSLALSRLWSASIRLLAYWLVSWFSPGSSSTMVRASAGDRSVVISAGSPWARIAVEKNRVAAFHVPLDRDVHVDVLPVLVNGAVHVPPGSGDLHVGLVDEPPATHGVAARPGRVDDQRREPLHPPVQGDVVDFDPT